MERASLYQDPQFRRIVVGSTGLGLACMLGTLASIRISPGVGLQFGWHWTILVFAAVVVLWNQRFWKVVWEMQDGASPGGKRKLVMHIGILLFLGVGSFLYPIRYVEQGYWNGILKGLVTAVTFLGTLFYLLYKTGKGFGEIDSAELKRHAEPAAETGA